MQFAWHDSTVISSNSCRLGIVPRKDIFRIKKFTSVMLVAITDKILSWR